MKTTIFDLCDMQGELDYKIITGKGVKLTGEELFDNTLVALNVELAEFANEGRWFKFWSNDQEPRTEVFNQGNYKQEEYDAFLCSSCRERYTKSETFSHDFSCPVDGGEIQAWKTTNPLLEEYVDALHFFLSLANQKGWQNALVINEFEFFVDRKAPAQINFTYLRLVRNLSDVFAKRDSLNFSSAWDDFLMLGIGHFGFTWEEITEAYLKKNKTNHNRQATGY